MHPYSARFAAWLEDWPQDGAAHTQIQHRANMREVSGRGLSHFSERPPALVFSRPKRSLSAATRERIRHMKKLALVALIFVALGLTAPAAKADTVVIGTFGDSFASGFNPLFQPGDLRQQVYSGSAFGTGVITITQ